MTNLFGASVQIDAAAQTSTVLPAGEQLLERLTVLRLSGEG